MKLTGSNHHRIKIQRLRCKVGAEQFNVCVNAQVASQVSVPCDWMQATLNIGQLLFVKSKADYRTATAS